MSTKAAITKQNTDSNKESPEVTYNDRVTSTTQPMRDTYFDLKTTTLLRHSVKLTKREQEIVLKILKYLAKTCNNKEAAHFKECVLSSNNWDELREKMYEEAKNHAEKDDNLTLDNLSEEYIIVQAALNFHLQPNSLLLYCMSIHFRVKPNNNKEEWLDNFSLNNFLYQLTTVTYVDNSDKKTDDKTDDKYEDDPTMLTIEATFEDESECINKKVKLTNPKRLLLELGNKYRIFNEFGEKAYETIINDDISDIQATNYLDKLVVKYPYYTYGCHGCDGFGSCMLATTLKDIYEFTSRYPHVVVGGILNSKTYASGKGEHWTANMFINKQCYLMCSFGSSFNSLYLKDSKTAFLDKLIDIGFGMKYNGVKIQEDSCNCGVYSILFNLLTLIKLKTKNNNNGSSAVVDIPSVINAIGKNGCKINNKGIYNIKEMVIGWSK